MKRTASNMNELETMLISEMRQAMDDTSKQMLSDISNETRKFYTKGKPKLYKRTGALGETPAISPLSIIGKTISFDAYLDTTHQYTTGKNPTMLDVLNLANYGTTSSSVGFLRHTLGERGFWKWDDKEDGEPQPKKEDEIFNRNMTKYFRKDKKKSNTSS